MANALPDDLVRAVAWHLTGREVRIVWASGPTPGATWVATDGTPVVRVDPRACGDREELLLLALHELAHVVHDVPHMRPSADEESAKAVRRPLIEYRADVQAALWLREAAERAALYANEGDPTIRTLRALCGLPRPRDDERLLRIITRLWATEKLKGAIE